MWLLGGARTRSVAVGSRGRVIKPIGELGFGNFRIESSGLM